MNFELKINLLTNNKVLIPKTNNFSAIVGLNPSQGARSPKLWNKAYSSFNISAKMIPIDVEAQKFDDLMYLLSSNPNFVGGSIAAPYKEKAAEFLQGNLTKEAKSINSINCFYRNIEGTLFGTNTDGEGALRSFVDKFGEIADKKILILGVGGTGKAVTAYFLSAVNSKSQIYIASRSASAKAFSRKVGCNSIEWETFPQIISQFDVIINCTSLGSTLNIGLMPMHEENFDYMKKEIIIYDVIYDPNPTPLLKNAMVRGLKTLNGGPMNIEQAVIGFNYSVSQGKLNFSNAKIRKTMLESI